VKRIVLAAFEPFGGRRINRAEGAVRAIRLAAIAGVTVEIERLPTAFDELPATIDRLLAPAPAALVIVGESKTARTLMVERFAVNLADARIPDNRGAQPRGARLSPSGPPAFEVRADVEALVAAAVRAGAPSAASAHAGTFCCNAALYHALGAVEARALETQVVFVHVPARFPWARDGRAARGLEAMVRSLAAHFI
jgi:pyroglutamyl-peptidase